MTEHTFAVVESEHSDQVGTFAIGNPPLVCALVGAPFGDLEFDIGKSVRWSEYFSDQLFVLDVNRGDPRYWVINWTKTFPNAEHSVTSTNFFIDPVTFRKEQFNRANAVFHFDPQTWIVWVDGSEGLSFDIASAAADPNYNANPFMFFIWREIERIQTAGRSVGVLPLFAFLRSDDITNVTYDQHISNPIVPGVLQPLSVPFYLPYQGLTRLTKVSALLDNNFNWTSIDTPSTADTGAKTQIISYAYAHWNIQDIPPGQSDVPELAVENDDGWRMRQLISLVRPIPGLPFSEEPPYTPTSAKLWLTAANFTPTGWPSGGATPMAMTQADQTKRPTLVTGFANGLPAVRFASKDSMFTTNPLLDQQGDWMIACVIATRPSNGDGMVWMFGREITLQRRAFWAHGSTGQIGFSGYDSNTLTTVPCAVPTLVIIARRTGVITIYVNGTSIGSGSPTLSAFTYNGFAVGANVSGSEGWAGDMGELIVAATTDTLTQLSIEGYLAWRYGLQGSLPPGHLFATAPPSSSGGTSPWNPANDVVGVPGPTAPSTVQNTHPDLVVVGTPGGSPAASTKDVLTPLYDCVFRLNMRDGVWYESGVSGNTPLQWDENDQKWIPIYDPAEWPDLGVDASVNPDLTQPLARTVFSGVPGSFMTAAPYIPATPPPNLADLNSRVGQGLMQVDSLYAWHDGEYIVLGDGSEVYYLNETPPAINPVPLWFTGGRAPTRIKLAVGTTIHSARFNEDVFMDLNNRYIGIDKTTSDPVGPAIERWASNQFATVVTTAGTPAVDTYTQVTWTGYVWEPYQP